MTKLQNSGLDDHEFPIRIVVAGSSTPKLVFSRAELPFGVSYSVIESRVETRLLQREHKWYVVTKYDPDFEQAIPLRPMVLCTMLNGYEAHLEGLLRLP